MLKLKPDQRHSNSVPPSPDGLPTARDPATRPVILVAESTAFSTVAAEKLAHAGHLRLEDLDRPALLRTSRCAEVLWVRLRHRIDEEVMAVAPQLKLIVTPTTGLDHIDLEAAQRRGIQVLSLRGETEFLRDVRATAEHTIGLMLALLRQLPAATEHARRGGWDRDLFRGRELYGTTVGVVGYGRLGRIVASYLHTFGARVLAADPHVGAESLEPHVALMSLPQLLEEAEIVTLHVNLRLETRGFFGAEQFQRMRPGAWLVNTARGDLVDEAALLEGLVSGRLGGAALDVLANESSTGMGDYPLVAYARANDNLILTPHLGGCTKESMEKAELFMVDKLCTALAGTATPV